MVLPDSAMSVEDSQSWAAFQAFACALTQSHIVQSNGVFAEGAVLTGLKDMTEHAPVSTSETAEVKQQAQTMYRVTRTMVWHRYPMVSNRYLLLLEAGC